MSDPKARSQSSGAAPPAASAAAASTSASPFDFDVDFEKVQKRRDAALQKKKQDALLAGMDAEDHEDHAAGDAVAKPNLNRHASEPITGAGGAKGPGPRGMVGWLKGRSAADAALEEEQKEDMLYGGKKVTQWPFDDYHFVQQQFYTKLEELQHQKPLEVSLKNKPATPSAAHMLTRPADPPEIPTAVLGLPLSQFENKAQERAIAIVSTWLFDAGLIDELLVHGGMGTSVTDHLNNNQHSSSPNNYDDPTVVSQEGVEIGAHGFPLEGVSKMDKEISKLKSNTQRQLTLINARLNDGVAASGLEVQELVNAVTMTKQDLGRLRELSTYISNAGDVETRSSKFMLTRYPKLKKAINARRNLARCFRELDFYSQIPLNCARLREELHSGEWTAQEWTVLRNVSREHVELEIFLVEAEAGMKKRIDEEREEHAEQGGGADTNRRRSSVGTGGASRFNRSTFSNAGLPHNYEEVDHFLQDHVKNVWELGDEIRLRIMSGIGTAFDLAMNNPAGMVALVEAVEVYETANEEYKTVHGEEAGSSQTLRFTDMRASALKQIYQDFELRGLEVFREVHENAERDDEEGEDTSNAHFSAVLRAANGLTSEIGFVQNQMAPCFPPYWALETLWSTCVAHVCSKQILEQIGGAEGHKLPDLTVTQLLDLVAWVENFRETIEESFPNIGEHTTKKTYFDERPELLMDGNKKVDMDVAKDSLAWANRMLWDVHDLAKDEFLFRTKEQTDEWLENVYEADHTKNQTSEGRLITSLCEDVFSLAGVQLRTIRERLSRRSEALVQAVGVIFKNLYEKQIGSRDNFLLDLETSCAAANDFIRMSERCEEILGELQAESMLTTAAAGVLEEQSAILLGLYSSDAVYAAQKVHVYIFEPIDEAISEELFGEEWLNELTGNELALTLVRTLEDFMGDLEVFLDELMVGKSVDALVTATVIFYIKCLLKKSASHKNNKQSLWSDNQKALTRMMGDIKVMKEYFVNLSSNYPALKRIVDNEFEALETIHELLSIAAGTSSSSKRDFILFLQKRIRNIPIVKYVAGDLWHMVKPTEEKAIYELVDEMEEEMKAIAPTDELAMSTAMDRKTVTGLRLDQEMAMLLDQNKRSRPGLKKGTVEQTEIMLNRWRETWVKLVDEAQ